MNNVIPGPQGGRRTPLEQFQPISPLDWNDGGRAPALDWLVEGCFLRGSVAILAGDGGLGKSLLLQQLMTAAAIGSPWLGLKTQRSRSLAICCEDDYGTLRRRQEHINDHYACDMRDLESVKLGSRVGLDNAMMRFGQWGGEGFKLPFFDQVEFAAIAHRAQIVVLDTLADVFAGNEIDRNQPKTFIRELRRLAIKLQGCVILTQHPSIEGMSSGTGRSGSTGWSNSVRSRLYLTEPKKKEGEPRLDRFLRTMKNNEGPYGGKLKLKWSRGVFIRAEEEAPDLYYARGGDELEF